MKIRMLVEMSGTRNGRRWPPRGGSLEMPEAEGRRLCASGLAEEVPERGRVETATARAAESPSQSPAEVPSAPRAEQRPAAARPRKPRAADTKKR